MLIPEIPEPKIDEERLFGSLDRNLSEMKFIIDNPQKFDTATFQTMKHHIEDVLLFGRYAEKKLAEIKALPPVVAQKDRGY